MVSGGREREEIMLIEGELSQQIIGAAIEVHRELGPGLLESAYEERLCHEFSLRGLRFQRQIELPVRYKELQLNCGYRMDLLVEEKIVLELKCVEAIAPIHKAQLLTYLRLSHNAVGLLLNFNVAVMKDGILRIVN